jgi:hypothetical protein
LIRNCGLPAILGNAAAAFYDSLAGSSLADALKKPLPAFGAASAK